jgi:hypothetical protein
MLKNDPATATATVMTTSNLTQLLFRSPPSRQLSQLQCSNLESKQLSYQPTCKEVYKSCQPDCKGQFMFMGDLILINF